MRTIFNCYNPKVKNKYIHPSLDLVNLDLVKYVLDLMNKLQLLFSYFTFIQTRFSEQKGSDIPRSLNRVSGVLPKMSDFYRKYP